MNRDARPRRTTVTLDRDAPLRRKTATLDRNAGPQRILPKFIKKLIIVLKICSVTSRHHKLQNFSPTLSFSPEFKPQISFYSVAIGANYGKRDACTSNKTILTWKVPKFTSKFFLLRGR